jgi:hypothetical protein
MTLQGRPVGLSRRSASKLISGRSQPAIPGTIRIDDRVFFLQLMGGRARGADKHAPTDVISNRGQIQANKHPEGTQE